MHKLSIAILLMGFGFLMGWYLRPPSPDRGSDEPVREVRLGKHTYTNPLLECDGGSGIGEKEYKPSKNSIASFLKTQEDFKTITHAAVYYRDLNNGPWFGINERDPFSPASLLKLPVLMAYLKQAEKHPDILEKKLTYTKATPAVIQTFIPASPLHDSSIYSVDQLLEHMIVYSDNDALFLLEKQIDNSEIDAVTNDLGIETATDTTPEDYMSVKSYASLLRVLYNASYLSREMSEKALGILVKTVFSNGIIAGLPKDIIVAHKFGERELPDGIKQLHDCGIVYVPRHPYLLCVMTRGWDFTALESVIATISKKIFEDIRTKFP